MYKTEFSLLRYQLRRNVRLKSLGEGIRDVQRLGLSHTTADTWKNGVGSVSYGAAHAPLLSLIPGYTGAVRKVPGRVYGKRGHRWLDLFRTGFAHLREMPPRRQENERLE